MGMRMDICVLTYVCGRAYIHVDGQAFGYPYSYGLPRLLAPATILYRFGLCSSSLYSYGLKSYGLCSYGLPRLLAPATIHPTISAMLRCDIYSCAARIACYIRDLCMEKFMTMCIGMYMDMCIGMCTDVCIGMQTDM